MWFYIIIGIIILAIIGWVIEIVGAIIGGIVEIVGVIIGGAMWIVGAIIGWAIANIDIIAVVVVAGICIYFFEFIDALIVTALMSLAVFITRRIKAYIKEKNEDELNTYLINNWFKYECVTEDEWKAKLPQFASKSYTTSFEQITGNFTKKIKQKNEDELNTYLTNNWFRYECVTEDEWKVKLPKFASKTYTTSFEQITSNFTKKIKQKNEDELNKYLINNCVRCGHVTEGSWKAMLPQFASKTYITSFKQITSNFAKKIEDKYIEGDEQLTWLNPAVHYLINNLIADITELERVPSEGLNFTHVTPNGKLIFDAMENLRKVKVIEGKDMIQKILLEPDAVRQELNLAAGASIPEYYMIAYKINDYYANEKKNNIEGNIESEEISLDDL